jgi:alcohol dehydrogenase YqhD (iron-dependent ADH family)
MHNFEFYTPTRVFFGRGVHKNAGRVIREYGHKKVLLIYGGGSIKKTGLYDEIIAVLKAENLEITEASGVQPNPELGWVLNAIDVCRANNCDCVLAVGGGSVIDAAKTTAVGVYNNCNPWDIMTGKKTARGTLPVFTVLTISAAGSETSSSAVLTDEKTQIKKGYNSPYNRPLVSFMNPELTYTLPPFQTACGVTDIFMHTVERYFSGKGDVEPTDSIAEALMKNTISAGRVALEKPNDYEARATLMLCGSLSHNDLTGLGRSPFLICHQLAHALSGTFPEIAHGAALSVVFPAWCKYIWSHDKERFARYARNVWGVTDADPEAAITKAIDITERFFKEIGMPIRLGDVSVDKEDIPSLAALTTQNGTRKFPSWYDYKTEDVEKIFRLAL